MAPATENNVITKVKKILKEYKLDGIWLDFIRWPCHWEGAHPKLIQTSFDQMTVSKFLGKTFIEDTIITKNPELILEQYLSEWTEWKCKQITNFVKKINQMIVIVLLREDMLLVLQKLLVVKMVVKIGLDIFLFVKL